MIDKVYGVYEGCIYEGGYITGPLFIKNEDAIKSAEDKFNEKVEEDRLASIRRKEEAVENNETEEMIESLEKMYSSFYWMKCEDCENRWHNTVDEIRVIEYKVI